jgi:prefoldin subunit 5
MINKFKELWADAGNRKVIILFIGIVVLLIASLFFQQNKMEQQMQLKVQFIEQKNMLRDELDDLIDEHDDLLDEYGDLNEQLHEKDSVIQHQIAEIRNLIRTKSDLNEARKKIAALKDISKRYLANIDSLLFVTEVLVLEKDSVVKVNKDINWKNYKLNKQNKKLAEKVSKGSVLEVFDVEIETIRYRSTGRELATKYAKKVQKIRTCFSVAANSISDAEVKTIYLQIIDKDGVLVSGADALTTTVADSLFNCTSSANFDYNNIEMTHCFEWERVQVLLPGKYHINLIIEGSVAAQTNLKLR